MIRTRNCLKDLIKILKEENIVVTPIYKFQCANKPVVENISGGSYIHIGMPLNLKKIADVIKLPENILIDVNIDGLPIFKSSKTQMWPILIRINNVDNRPVFPVGVFVGKSKPTVCEDFLSKFVDEFSYNLESGGQITAFDIVHNCVDAIMIWITELDVEMQLCDTAFDSSPVIENKININTSQRKKC